MSAPVLPKGHEEYAALAVAWAIDALEPADHERFEAHRDGCDDCERTVRDALEVAVELAYGVPDIAPPPSLRLRVLATAASEPPAPGASAEDLPGPAAPSADVGAVGGITGSGNRQRSDVGRRPDGLPRPDDGDGDDPAAGHGRHAAPRGPASDTDLDGRWTREDRRTGADRRAGADDGHLIDRRGHRPGTASPLRRSRRRLVSVFAAAALVGLSAVTTWQVTRPAPVSAPIAAADRVAALTSTDGNRALATVVVRDGRADVVTDGLPTTTGTTAYYVWGMPAGDAGVPQVVGTFEVTEDGLHSYPVRLTRAIGDYPVLAVSQEQAGSTPTTPSDVLARGALS